jgi:hypothetical protein
MNLRWRAVESAVPAAALRPAAAMGSAPAG